MNYKDQLLKQMVDGKYDRKKYLNMYQRKYNLNSPKISTKPVTIDRARFLVKNKQENQTESSDLTNTNSLVDSNSDNHTNTIDTNTIDTNTIDTNTTDTNTNNIENLNENAEELTNDTNKDIDVEVNNPTKNFSPTKSITPNKKVIDTVPKNQDKISDTERIRFLEEKVSKLERKIRTLSLQMTKISGRSNRFTDKSIKVGPKVYH
ncbi:hypothetical protein QJ850_gp672 [Acanthamoeba polyphaga mimivirus]|uniref:Uncharacterized protein n=1 Tax=Acanthamoeba polyphaga mimivirus Kroon TaxID=3069720 RepID=A0A0G2Y8B9_9VIRU|nr:hypothetical protein QJ850_gp672 [Acanthamoeba polyphaga mimivirus]AKI80027.1 hypothetical protein [Acanthamoeba polyphaga mimivirus Kroon]